jgi:uroporphyrinogen-III decarboxylase
MPGMTTRERLLAVWSGQPADYVPLTMWCFGFPAPPALRWSRNGRPVSHWFTKRLEHIHTLPQPWELEDDFERVLAWRSLGVDDVLDVSVPWSIDPQVTWHDATIPAGAAGGHPQYPVLVREYRTPASTVRHAVRQTGEDAGPGWVIQADHVPLFDDMNVPRSVKPAVAGPADVPAISHLYQRPDAAAQAWFAERMARVGAFARRQAVPVRAWAAFGMDAIVWLMGAENAVLMAIDEPRAFGQLVDIVAEADYHRVALAAAHPDVDLIAERGWYSSTDFWSLKLFDQFVFPQVKQLADLAHRYGKKFLYTLEKGTLVLGPRVADAGVDVLYGLDTHFDKLALEEARDTLGGRLTMEGGTHSMTLAARDPARIRAEVRRALDVLGPTGRFILHPLDSLFPDTPWESVECLIEAWKRFTR